MKYADNGVQEILDVCFYEVGKRRLGERGERQFVAIYSRQRNG